MFVVIFLCYNWIVEILEVETSRVYQLLDITTEVTEIVKDSGIEEGVCLVFAPHATAGIMLEENERGLKQDFVRFFKDLAERGQWEHDRIDDNASAHLLAGIVGQSRTLPISEGNLVRGTWQNIFLVELDGPRRSRRVCISIQPGDGKYKRI